MFDLKDALGRAENHSPFLRQLMKRFPDTTDQLHAGNLDAALAVALEDKPLAAALRRARGRLALAVAVGDLAGALSLEDVTGHLTRFADFAMDKAITGAIDAVVPGAEPRGFTAIALGKQGGGELNYSSDLDPILIFDPETLPRRQKDEPVEAAVRIGRKMVELLQARDGDGYVFRIDLRLRPSPEATPMALPIDAAIAYYESQALAWERAAFIRSRSCAGDIALGTEFLDAIKPFVWRRGVDFGAIKEVRNISARIRDHYAQGQAFGPGFDLKRGRGGIRECEFFAQIHQLIHGGRDTGLRMRATIPALNALAAAGWIGAEEAETLSSSYRLYRTIEHRLQMVDDQQTHSLPAQAEALENVAHLHGLENSAALLDLLSPHVKAVGLIYDGLDPDENEGLPNSAERLNETLLNEGYAPEDAEHLAARIADWRGGTLRSVRTPAAREAFEAVLPPIIKAFARAPAPRQAITRFYQMLARLPSSINMFRLIVSPPALRDRLSTNLCHTPTLAEALSRRAELLDGLIDSTALDPVDSVEALVQAMTLPDAMLEDQLDRVRQFVGEKRFALGAQIATGISDPLDVASGYARVAEAAVRVVTNATVRAFEEAHGTLADSELVILALGRFGGGELTHASDLDLIYLFTGDFAAESNGRRPLGAVHYFNRLGQRITNGLSVATASGPLYEVDTRLRPSGADGPLAVSLDAFERYQRESAWTWEHMALTRARPVYGSSAARAAVQSVIDAELARPRDPVVVVADAAKMRADMAAHKPGKTGLDVKLLPGGLVDLEFAIHVSQLTQARGFNPRLAEAIAALEWGRDVAEAYALLTRFLVTMRLVAPDLEEPVPATRALVAKACDAPDWDSLLHQIETVRATIAALWTQVKEG